MPTNEEKMIELARRAVACPKWKWLPGMQGQSPGGDFSGAFTVLNTALSELRTVVVHEPSYDVRRKSDCHYESLSAALPDLADPATIGCLLALVREALGERFSGLTIDPNACALGIKSDVALPGCAMFVMGVSCFTFGSEAEALVAALEAAPQPV